MPVGASDPVLQPPEALILVTIENLLARLAGDLKLPTQDGHLLAIE